MEFFSLFEVTPWKYSWTIPHLATSTYLRSICSVPNRWYLILKACTASWTFYIDWFSHVLPRDTPDLGSPKRYQLGSPDSASAADIPKI